MKVSQLNTVRIMLGITQSELAKATGMTQGLVSKLEAGYLKTWSKYEPKIIAAFEAKRASIIEDLDDQKRMLLNMF